MKITESMRDLGAEFRNWGHWINHRTSSRVKSGVGAYIAGKLAIEFMGVPSDALSRLVVGAQVVHKLGYTVLAHLNDGVPAIDIAALNERFPRPPDTLMFQPEELA